MKYEIINHGWENSQYFQGCGTYGTPFEDVVTGSGMDAKEAYEDALEQLPGSLWEKLPTRPRGIRRRDKVPAKAEDCYYYVSIRY